jgi:hypothetical protein
VLKFSQIHTQAIHNYYYYVLQQPLQLLQSTPQLYTQTIQQEKNDDCLAENLKKET